MFDEVLNSHKIIPLFYNFWENSIFIDDLKFVNTGMDENKALTKQSVLSNITIFAISIGIQYIKKSNYLTFCC